MNKDELLEELGERASESWRKGDANVLIPDVCFIEILNQRIFNPKNRRELNLIIEGGGYVHKLHIENITFISYSEKPIYETDRL